MVTLKTWWGWNILTGTSLVVHWLRICLPMQGTQVPFLVRELRSIITGQSNLHTTTREEPAHSRACAPQEKPMCHNKDPVQPKKKELNAINFSISSAFTDATNFNKLHFILGFLGGSDGKESTCNVGDLGFDCWVGKIPWRREWLPTPV